MRQIRPLIVLSLITSFARAADVPSVIAPQTDFATPVITHTGKLEGPTVLVLATPNDRRIAPARTVEEVATWPIHAGRLVLIENASKLTAALSSPQTSTPFTTFLKDLHPDYLLDLRDTATTTSPVFATTSDPARITRLLDSINPRIDGESDRFALEPGVSLSPIVAAAADKSPNILTIDVAGTIDKKTRGLPTRTRQQRLLVHTLLRDLKMTDADANQLLPTSAAAESAAGKLIRVAIYDATGVGGAGPTNIDQALRARPGFISRRVESNEIKDGVLSQFDVLIQPGGTGSGQGNALSDQGRANVRAFMEQGGGYIGICAGCYLSTCKYTWSLGILNAKTVDSAHWARGKADLDVELTPLGKQIFGDHAGGFFKVLYHNGPVLTEADRAADLGSFEPLAYFRSEVTAKGAKEGLMVNTPAMVAAHFGKGRVISISPHPEQTPGLEDFIPRAVRYVAGRPVE